MRLVACKLRGGVSAWWERFQTRRVREEKQPVKTWFRMEQLLKIDFLPLDHEQIVFQPYQICYQDARLVYEYPVDFMRSAERNDLQDMMSKFDLKNEIHLSLTTLVHLKMKKSLPSNISQCKIC